MKLVPFNQENKRGDMPLQTGDPIPSATLYVMKDGKPEAVGTQALLGKGTVALFGVPGAFTPTCSAQHLPGYIAQAMALKSKGVDAIVCLAVNDVFVMDAWGREKNAGNDVIMAADGDGEFTKAAGLELDLTGKGLGPRCQRFSMLIEDGVVRNIAIDTEGFEATSAEKMLEIL